MLIKDFEGLSLIAYPDPATGGEPWTIGYGHTGDVKEGMTITEHQADAILDYDLSTFEEWVNAHAPSLNDNQFAAVVSFTFNLGMAALARSTLLKHIHAGRLKEAANEFMKWKYAAGKVMPGLVRRRAAERELFLRPV